MLYKSKSEDWLELHSKHFTTPLAPYYNDRPPAEMKVKRNCEVLRTVMHV